MQMLMHSINFFGKSQILTLTPPHPSPHPRPSPSPNPNPACYPSTKIKQKRRENLFLLVFPFASEYQQKGRHERYDAWGDICKPLLSQIATRENGSRALHDTSILRGAVLRSVFGILIGSIRVRTFLSCLGLACTCLSTEKYIRRCVCLRHVPRRKTRNKSKINGDGMG
jgi:hypothetical protein